MINKELMEELSHSSKQGINMAANDLLQMVYNNT